MRRPGYLAALAGAPARQGRPVLLPPRRVFAPEPAGGDGRPGGPRAPDSVAPRIAPPARESRPAPPAPEAATGSRQRVEEVATGEPVPRLGPRDGGELARRRPVDTPGIAAPAQPPETVPPGTPAIRPPSVDDQARAPVADRGLRRRGTVLRAPAPALEVAPAPSAGRRAPAALGDAEPLAQPLAPPRGVPGRPQDGAPPPVGGSAAPPAPAVAPPAPPPAPAPSPARPATSHAAQARIDRASPARAAGAERAPRPERGAAASLHIGTVEVTVLPAPAPPSAAPPLPPAPRRSAAGQAGRAPLSRGAGPWYGLAQR